MDLDATQIAVQNDFPFFHNRTPTHIPQPLPPGILVVQLNQKKMGTKVVCFSGKGKTVDGTNTLAGQDLNTQKPGVIGRYSLQWTREQKDSLLTALTTSIQIHNTMQTQFLFPG